MTMNLYGNHRLTYSMLDAVPPIHAESSHVATDMDLSK